MKTILRILPIFSIALAISGITWLVVRATSSITSSSLNGNLPGNGFPSNSSRFPASGQPPAGFDQSGSRNPDRNGGNFTWGETLKNILVIAAFIVGVGLIERFWKTLRRKKLILATGERRAD
jgi:hypothetical protein